MALTDMHPSGTVESEPTVKRRQQRRGLKNRIRLPNYDRRAGFVGMLVVPTALFSGIVGYETGKEDGSSECASSITPDSIRAVGDPQVLTEAEVANLETMVNSSRNAPVQLTDSALKRAGLLTVMDQLDSDGSRTLQAKIPTGPKGDGIHVLDVGAASKLTTNIVGFSDNEAAITSISAEISSDYTAGKDTALIFQVGEFTCPKAS